MLHAGTIMPFAFIAPAYCRSIRSNTVASYGTITT